MESWTSERARFAALSRSREPDDPDLLEARRNLRSLKLEELVAKAVAAAPPLTEEQKARIAALLRGASPSNLAPLPPAEPTEEERKAEAERAHAKRVAETAQTCFVCGGPGFMHGKTIKGHEWRALSADQIRRAIEEEA